MMMRDILRYPPPLKMIPEVFFKWNKSSNLAHFLCVNWFYLSRESQYLNSSEKDDKSTLSKPNSYKKEFKNTSIH